MLGAIIGDIVGSRWEFDPTNILKVFLVLRLRLLPSSRVATGATSQPLLSIPAMMSI